MTYIRHMDGFFGDIFETTQSLKISQYSIDTVTGTYRAHYETIFLKWASTLSKRCKKRLVKHIKYVEKEINYRSVRCFIMSIIHYFNLSFKTYEKGYATSDTLHLKDFKMYKSPEDIVDSKIKGLFDYLKKTT